MSDIWTCTCCGSSAIAQDALVEANGGAVLSVYDAMACGDCGSTDIDLAGPDRPAAAARPSRPSPPAEATTAPTARRDEVIDLREQVADLRGRLAERDRTDALAHSRALLDRVADMAGDPMWSGDIAMRLTCEEAEVLADVLHHVGRGDEVAGFLARHAENDCEVEDTHHHLYLEAAAAAGGPVPGPPPAALRPAAAQHDPGPSR